MSNKKFNKFNGNKNNHADQDVSKYDQSENQNRERSGKFAKGKKNCFINPKNDFAWYNNNQLLTNDSTGISFNNAVGRPIYLGNYELNVPGVMSLTLAYGPGVSNDSFSAVNQAALRVYSNTRRANSGGKVYDSPDEMMYIIAVDSLYTIYSWMVRLYGVMSQYNALNMYTPRVLVAAMGADFDSFQKNLANFRYYLNTLPGKMVNMAIPNTLPYTQRHAWLFSNLYKDGESQKSQVYMFNPDCYYTWEEVTEGPGYLKYNYFPRSGITYESITTLFDTMIIKLLGSQDIGTICGDIIKAYEGRVVTVSQIQPDYAVVPVFNMEVLSQIQNATVIDGAVLTGDIKQSTGVGTPTILWQPTIFHPDSKCGWRDKDRIITLPKDKPTAQDIVEATRLTTMLEASSSTASKITSCMTEFVTDAKIYTLIRTTQTNSTGETVVVYKAEEETLNNFTFMNTATAETTAAWIKDICLWSYFDWAPAYYFATKDAESHEVLQKPLFEVNNYTSVPLSVVEKLHNTCRLSLFDIPSDGKLS